MLGEASWEDQRLPSLPSPLLVKQGVTLKEAGHCPEQWHRYFATKRQAIRTGSSKGFPKETNFIWNRMW